MPNCSTILKSSFFSRIIKNLSYIARKRALWLMTPLQTSTLSSNQYTLSLFFFNTCNGSYLTSFNFLQHSGTFTICSQIRSPISTSFSPQCLSCFIIHFLKVLLTIWQHVSFKCSQWTFKPCTMLRNQSQVMLMKDPKLNRLYDR